MRKEANMKNWKQVISNKRILALLLAVTLAIPTGSGFVVHADSTTNESATESITQNVKQESVMSKAMKWDFTDVSQVSDFSLYQSGTNSFAIQDGVLTPNGTNGEMKAILNTTVDDMKSVSVDIIPGESGIINAGLYLEATNVGNAVDEIDALAFLVESNFTGWADAPNRIDIVKGTFSNHTWRENERYISEKGSSNALFSGGNKQPLNLKLEFEEEFILLTLSLVSNPAKCVQEVYAVDSETFNGKIGLRANGTDIRYDNLTITYESTLPENATYDFASNTQLLDFSLYQSGTSSFAVQDGLLVPNGTNGEMKAILNADIENLKSVSVDIKPGDSGLIDAGVYIGASAIGNNADEINALAFLVQSNFSGWNGAENRTDLITCTFPWNQIGREIIEGSDAFFEDGNKEPLNLKLDFAENTVTATLTVISDPTKSVQATYTVDSTKFDGKIGFRANNSDVCFDNLKIQYQAPQISVTTYQNEGHYFYETDKWHWRLTEDLTGTPYTLEAWVNVSEVVGDDKAGYIVGNSFRAPYVSMQMISGGNLRLAWGTENEDLTISSLNFDANVDIRNGKWTHVAYTWDAVEDKVVCYVNGEVVTTWENAGLSDISIPDHVEPSNYFSIGANHAFSSNPISTKFMGKIADVRMWNKPLSETDLKQSMMTQYTSEKEGLLFNAPLNETVNDMFLDLSGNENHVEEYENDFNLVKDSSEPGDYSIVVMPDQQILTNYYPERLNKMYQWIADNAEKENIQMVINVGDLADNCGNVTQWERCQEAYELLPEDLPFIAVPGNHDYDTNSGWNQGYGIRSQLTLMNQYFPMSLFENYETDFGALSRDTGVEDNVANTWQSFEVYGNKYLVIALEYVPRDDAIEWANDVVEAHPDHQVIVVTHSYQGGDGNVDRAYVWNKFISQHENIIMTFSGHVWHTNVVRRTDVGVHGNEVTSILMDAQMLDQDSWFDGLGMVGVLRFNEEGTECKVSYYSTYNEKADEGSYFTLTLPAQNGSYVPETTDKSSLSATIDAAKVLKEDDYTMASWPAFAEVLVKAQETLEDDNAKQHIIDYRTEQLQDAMDKLVSLGEYGEETLYTFENEMEAEDFAFYHSSNGGFEIQDGVLVPNGETGEFKAIIEKNERQYKSMSVDIIPGASGMINAGIYIGASNANHPVDKINALSIGIESSFSGWEDAANRVDLVVGTFPVWKELSRTISETGNGNNLYTDGVKQPLNLKVDIDGDIVTITLSLRDNPSTYIQTVYQYTGEGELAAGYVGLRSAFNDSSFDNLYLLYDQYVNKAELKEAIADVEKLEEEDYTDKSWATLRDALKAAKKVLNDAEATQDEVEAALKTLQDAKAALETSDLYTKVAYTFEELKEALDFDFYHSSNGGFTMKDGKLTTSGEVGETKAILKGINRAYKTVSVDIYPGKDGTINSGLYIHAAGFGHAQDKGHALGIGVESNFTGWEDAANRVDIVVGSFPAWKELSRTTSETGAGNALFTDGKKEPLNLKVDIEEKQVTITVSLLSNPDVFVETVYEYTGDGNLTHGRVGMRSLNVGDSFDNFEAVYKTEVYSEEEITGPITENDDKNPNAGTGSPDTGDNMSAAMAVVMLAVSFGVILFLFDKRRKKSIQ